VNEEALAHWGLLRQRTKIYKTRELLGMFLETQKNTLNFVRIDSSVLLRIHFDFYPSLGLT
jgi:hypothetical protein